MLKILKSDPNKPLGCEEYDKGTKVTNIKSRGRGLISSDEIHAGDLILASRALALVNDDKRSQLPSPLLTRVKRFRMLKEVVAVTVTNLESAIKVYQLHAGPKMGYLQQPDIERQFHKNPVDKARIEGICLVNALSSGESSYGSQNHGGGGCFGLWDRVSYINHSCSDANATWMIISDFVFVRAAKNIQKGEEILISYIDPHQMYSARREMFLKHDFICKCKMCQSEANEDPELQCERENLLCQIITECENSRTTDPEQIVSTLNKLNSSMLYSDDSSKDVYKLKPLIHLGVSCYENNNFDKAIEVFENAFNICQHFVQLNPAKLFLAVAMSRANMKCGRLQDIKKWIRITKQLISIQYGDEDPYEICSFLYADFVNEMHKGGVNVFNIYNSGRVQ